MGSPGQPVDDSGPDAGWFRCNREDDLQLERVGFAKRRVEDAGVFIGGVRGREAYDAYAGALVSTVEQTP